MLFMCGLGVGSLVWMAVLTGVMVVEKTYPGGQRLSPFIGVTLLLLAVLRLSRPAWCMFKERFVQEERMNPEPK